MHFSINKAEGVRGVRESTNKTSYIFSLVCGDVLVPKQDLLLIGLPDLDEEWSGLDGTSRVQINFMVYVGDVRRTILAAAREESLREFFEKNNLEYPGLSKA